MKFAIAALTLASAILSASVDARPVRRACPVKHHSHTSAAAATSTLAATTATTATTVAVPTTTAVPTAATTSVVAPVHTSSSAAAVTPTKITAPVTGGGSHPKRGISFNKAADTLPFANSASWAYNWGQSTWGATIGTGEEFVPMLWGTRADDLKNWKTNAEAAIAAGAKYFLGYNEPDHPDQANITPEAAATAWIRDMNPYAGRVKLVSPAITNGPADKKMGAWWLDAFFKACDNKCHVDEIAIHIYDAPSNIKYFQNYITDMGTKYGKPVWVSEFGVNSGTTEEQKTFFKDMATFLDGLSSVTRYAAFGIPNGLFVKDGTTTTVGDAYKSA